MSQMSLGQVALVSSVAGCFVALGVMGAVAARVAITITRGHRWGDLRKL